MEFLFVNEGAWFLICKKDRVNLFYILMSINISSNKLPNISSPPKTFQLVWLQENIPHFLSQSVGVANSLCAFDFPT